MVLALPLLGAMDFRPGASVGGPERSKGGEPGLSGRGAGVAVFLVMRPVWVAKQPRNGLRPVAVLVDKSESMSLEEGSLPVTRRRCSFCGTSFCRLYARPICR